MKGFLRAFLTLAIVGSSLSNGAAWAERKGLGDLGFDPIQYRATLKEFPPYYQMAVPTSFDWRDYGIVTPAKDQGYCGSCWAFASVGVFESKILLAGGSMYDLAEQQLVSCDKTMLGCCGGNYLAMNYWYANSPILENCAFYGDYTTQCPTRRNTLCADLICDPLSWHTANLFTINTSSPADVKTSVYEDGPAYFSFQVYSDFFTYWDTAAPGAVYTQTSGALEGGHAVLIIGWDDAKQAWLLKNSWGATGGPNGDGTFWIAWAGHTNNLSFGMANVDLASAPADLTRIDLMAPADKSTQRYAPTFKWTPDGGTNNTFAVEWSYSATLTKVRSTDLTYGLTITQNSWKMPKSIWKKIPSKTWVYWRVRGKDLNDVLPTTIMSGQTWSFYKP